MNLKLEDIYKVYKELETTIEQFRESKFKTLSELLGHDRAFKAAFTIEFAEDLLTYLKKFEGWTDEEKFLDTYIRNKKFLVGVEYVVFHTSGSRCIMPETAIICSRTEIDRATWAVLKFGPIGSEKVYLAEISTEGNIEKISFENFVLYSDRVAYTCQKNF